VRLARALATGPSAPETGLDGVPGPVRATTPGAGVLPGVVARSEVDAVPGRPGQGGGPVVGHDGGDGGVNPAG
jgi:hypothetical protein